MGNQIPWFDLTTFNMKVLITLALLFACALANPRYPREDTEITKNQEKEIGGEYDDYEPHQQDLKSNVHQIEKRSEKKKKKTLYLGSRRTEDSNSQQLWWRRKTEKEDSKELPQIRKQMSG